MLAVVTNTNARLDAMEATVNALADSGGRLDALEGAVQTLQDGLADSQANFAAVRAPRAVACSLTRPPPVPPRSLTHGDAPRAATRPSL